MRNDNILNLRGYGDTTPEQLKKDILSVQDILSRQGTNFLHDVIAENTGKTAIKFKLDAVECGRILNNQVDDYRNALSERL